MTCHHADTLIEDVLNGEKDAEGEDGLREHLKHCGRCAEAWHVAWQVRQTLNQCEVSDPGESYLQQATASIMARIRAIDPDAVAAEGSPAISSARYGPLQIRGVGLAVLMAVGFFVQAFRAPVAYSPMSSADPRTKDMDRARMLDVAEAPDTNPFAADHAAAPANHHPLLLRLRNLQASRSPSLLDRLRRPLLPSAPPPCLVT